MPARDPDPAWSRRAVLKLGAAAAFAAGARSAPAQSATAMQRNDDAPFRTPLSDLLGISHPVLQAPMAGPTTPEMVAAVGEAGGLGLLPGVGVPPEELRQRIRRVRELTARPFGVNLLLYPDIHAPPDPGAVPEETVRGAQEVLNRFRARLGIPPSQARPPHIPATNDAAFEVILAERVPVFSVGLGKPPAEWVTRCREHGIKVIAMASTVADARALADTGVDAVVAQGSEAGGHRSTWRRPQSPERAMIGSLALVPQVVDAVGVPVIAAGGITDGRQLLAALVLGAGGVLMGTRFIATRESAAPAVHREALVRGDADETVLTNVFTGMYARVLRNAFTEEYRASGAPVFPAFLHYAATGDVREAAARQGNRDYLPLYAGQGIGLIRDAPGAADVVRTVVQEARAALDALPGRVLAQGR